MDFSEIFATEDSFFAYFNSEETGKRFMENIRWGNTIICPYCGYDRIYRTRSGSNDFKCASNKCYKKFTVKNGTIIRNSNISVIKWIWFAYKFVERNGRGSVSALDNKISWIAALGTDERLRDGFNVVDKKNKNKSEIFLELLRVLLSDNIIPHSSALELRKRASSIIDDKLYDFSNNNDYRIILAFIKKQQHYNVIRKYNFWIFCDPEDILAEMIVAISESGKSEFIFQGSYLVSIVRKTISRMWVKYCNDTPKLSLFLYRYNKQWREDQNHNLGYSFVMKNLVSKFIKENHFVSSKDARKAVAPKIIEERKKLIDFRKRNGRYYNPEIESKLVGGIASPI